MFIPIDPNREYAPSEIFKNGFILNTKGKADYLYVIRLINRGRLRARNVCLGKHKKYYKVLGSDIIAWKKSTARTIPVQPTAFPVKFGEKRPFDQSAHVEQ